MSKKKDAAVAFEIDRPKALRWLAETDGYGVFAPEFFDGILPPRTVKRLTFDHAGGEGKHAVTKGGEVLRKCVGVSEFAAIDALASELGVEPVRFFLGRGRNFRETRARCLVALAQ